MHCIFSYARNLCAVCVCMCVTLSSAYTASVLRVADTELLCDLRIVTSNLGLLLHFQYWYGDNTVTRNRYWGRDYSKLLSLLAFQAFFDPLISSGSTCWDWVLPCKCIMLVCFPMCLLIWKKTIEEKESKESEGAMIMAMEGIHRWTVWGIRPS